MAQEAFAAFTNPPPANEMLKRSVARALGSKVARDTIRAHECMWSAVLALEGLPREALEVAAASALGTPRPIGKLPTRLCGLICPEDRSRLRFNSCLGTGRSKGIPCIPVATRGAEPRSPRHHHGHKSEKATAETKAHQRIQHLSPLTTYAYWRM